MSNERNSILKAIDSFKKLCNVDIMESSTHNFINEFFGTGITNKQPLVPLTEMTVDRLLGKHYNNGFIIISASRSENGRELNNKLTKELISVLKNSPYSFVPVYGGYIENKGTPNEVTTYEASFIVLNFDKQGNETDMNALIDFGKKLQVQFNQEDILVKEPNGTPRYINQNGETSMEFNGDVKINDLTQEYFTSFIKSKNIANDQENRRKSRFTFESCYINPKPSTFSERVIRRNIGEIFLD